MQDAIYHCHDIAYPLQSDTFDRHSRPLMPWYHLACYHCICSRWRVPQALNAHCIEYSEVSGACSSGIILLLTSLKRLHEYYTRWVDSQKIALLLGLKRHPDGCEMLERHRRTKCWPTPSITHAEQMTQFSLSLLQRASLSVLPRIFNREESAPVGSHLHRCPSGRSCLG